MKEIGIKVSEKTSNLDVPVHEPKPKKVTTTQQKKAPSIPPPEVIEDCVCEALGTVLIVGGLVGFICGLAAGRYIIPRFL